MGFHSSKSEKLITNLELKSKFLDSILVLLLIITNINGEQQTGNDDQSQYTIIKEVTKKK